MKKLLSLLLVAMMLLSLAPLALAEEKVEIEYWFGVGGSLGDTYLRVIDEFNQSQDKVHVTGVQYPDNSAVHAAYQAALAAKQPPATLVAHPDNARAFADYLEPLNEYFKDPDFHAETLFEGAMEWAYKSGTDTILGIPFRATCQVMYYRKDAFEGYDIDEVFSTWQNLEKTVYEIAQKDENGNTTFYGWEPMCWSNGICDAVYSYGGSIYTDDTLRTVNFLDEKWVETFTAFKKWINEDKVMGIHYGGTGWEYWYKTIDDVMMGKAAGYTGSVADQGDLDFSIIGVHAQPGWGDHPSSVLTDVALGVMSAGISDEEKAAAWEFLKWLSSDYVMSEVFFASGYVPTRSSVMNAPKFAAFCEENDYAADILEAISMARAYPGDPTGGKVYNAIADCVSRIWIENEDVIESLEILQEEAQAILDEYWESVE